MTEEVENNEENLEELLNEEGEELTSEEEEAAFNQGFGEEADEYEEVSPEEEDPEEEKAPEIEAKEKEPEAPNPLDQARAENAALNDRLRKIEGRFGELNAKVKASEEAKKLDRGPGFPSKDEVVAAKSPEDLEILKERYPAWSDEVEEREALMQARLGVDEFVTREDLAAMAKAEALQGYVSKDEIGAIIAREREQIFLEVKHPDYKQTVRSEDFQGWLQKQGAPAVELYRSRSSADASKLLTQYAKHTDSAAKELEKQGRLEDAVPATRGGRNASNKTTSEQEEFEAAYKR
jgi:hypothetical protein